VARSTFHRLNTALAVAGAATLATFALGPVALAAPTEHISNGSFTSSVDPWWGTDDLSLKVTSGRLCTQVPSGTENAWDAIVGYNGVPLVKGDKYTLKFQASTSVASTVKANVQLSEDPWTPALSRDTALSSSLKSFTYTFTSTLDSDSGTLQFQVGGGAKAMRFCLDNVSLTSETGSVGPVGPEQVINGSFEEGLNPWYAYGTDSADVQDGMLCASVPEGLENPWDAGIGQNDITLVEGEDYTFSFNASADPKASVRANVQLGEDPYTTYFSDTVSLGSSMRKFSYTFTASADTSIAQVAFQVGGSSSPYTFCVDDVSLRGGE
jgi:endoglucanase